MTIDTSVSEEFHSDSGVLPPKAPGSDSRPSPSESADDLPVRDRLGTIKVSCNLEDAYLHAEGILEHLEADTESAEDALHGLALLSLEDVSSSPDTVAEEFYTPLSLSPLTPLSAILSPHPFTDPSTSAPNDPAFVSGVEPPPPLTSTEVPIPPQPTSGPPTQDKTSASAISGGAPLKGVVVQKTRAKIGKAKRRAKKRKLVKDVELEERAKSGIYRPLYWMTKKHRRQKYLLLNYSICTARAAIGAYIGINRRGSLVLKTLDRLLHQERMKLVPWDGK